ncbi:hypothetical protein ULMS_13810 [Patiriisocius marinistellae]|uniref:YARHG domain-containing protein n=1 Tax=Patiriisocius marinistellae TaxID=2494560 RepID=A0A5J4FVE5_9FLAO|nr:YARHG domain-containing protein [Patiriisocius marinistellae]GEQ85873.1 hypothetical protein ULMS_13810 [Patiriisocius marinistellae]
MKNFSYLLSFVIITSMISCSVLESNTVTKNTENEVWIEESKKDFDYFLNWYEESGNEVLSRDYTIIDISKNRNKRFPSKKRRLDAGVEEAYTLNIEYEGNWKAASPKERVEFIYAFNDNDSIISKSMIAKDSHDIPIIYKKNSHVAKHFETVTPEKTPEVIIKEETPKKAAIKQPTVNGRFPKASTTQLSLGDLESYSKKDLKIMRNEIFARHGHTFLKGREMDTYFKSQSWYENKNLDATNLLTETEIKNIQLIKTLE